MCVRERERETHTQRERVCVCVCVCARARVRECVRACVVVCECARVPGRYLILSVCVRVCVCQDQISHDELFCKVTNSQQELGFRECETDACATPYYYSLLHVITHNLIVCSLL